MSKRGGRGWVLSCECLVSEVKFITMCVWMKVRGERGRLALCVGCIYMPTDSSCARYFV